MRNLLLRGRRKPRTARSARCFWTSEKLLKPTASSTRGAATRGLLFPTRSQIIIRYAAARQRRCVTCFATVVDYEAVLEAFSAAKPVLARAYAPIVFAAVRKRRRARQLGSQGGKDGREAVRRKTATFWLGMATTRSTGRSGGRAMLHPLPLAASRPEAASAPGGRRLHGPRRVHGPVPRGRSPTPRRRS